MYIYIYIERERGAERLKRKSSTTRARPRRGEDHRDPGHEGGPALAGLHPPGAHRDDRPGPRSL